MTGSVRLASMAANMKAEVALLNAKWLVTDHPAFIDLNGVNIPILASRFPSAQYCDMANWVAGMNYTVDYGSSGWNEESHGVSNQTIFGWFQNGATGTG